MRWPRRWVPGTLVMAITATAAASPDLRLREAPPPRPTDLRMRTAAVEAPEVVVTAQGAVDADTPPRSEQIVARVDVGLGVDGARPSGEATLGGACGFPGATPGDGVCLCPTADPDDDPAATEPCDPQDFEADYASVRSYGFTEVYLGTRGVAHPSLSTYLSVQSRIATQARFTRADAPVTAPIASPYDRTTDLQTRAFWVETDDLFRRKWLRPLRLRAGRMFFYGPSIVHLDGLVVAWERDWLELSSYSGARVPAFRVNGVATEIERGAPLSGVEVRADLRRFGLPVSASGATLRHLGESHSVIEATALPRDDIVIRSSTRFHDGRLARQRLVVRARISEESTIIVENQLRTDDDWFWDYASLTAERGAPDEDDIATRYLDLGKVRPRFHTALLAGTVLAQNVDLLARAAFAVDVTRGTEEEEAAVNPHLPEYVEGGAGIEVRLRRALGLQAMVLVRDYKRTIAPQDDTDAADPLPDLSELGEERLVEGSLALRYTLGARRFSGNGELYLRQTKWGAVYCDGCGTTEAEATFDMHGGGRFWVEAWVNPRVRLRGEYDVSTLLDLSPEFRGLKTLRLLLEGTY